MAVWLPQNFGRMVLMATRSWQSQGHPPHTPLHSTLAMKRTILKRPGEVAGAHGYMAQLLSVRGSQYGVPRTD